MSWYKPHLNLSLDLILQFAGSKDAKIIDVEGAGNNRLPVQQIDPHDGEVLWFTDQLALSLLKKEPKEQNRND